MFVSDPSVEVPAAPFNSRLRAPFAVLQRLLGRPLEVPPEKCSTCWSLRHQETKVGGAYLKDWQDEDDRSLDVGAFRALPSYDWHVLASDVQMGETLCRWLSDQVIAQLGSARVLSPSGKDELNRLIAAGVPFAEAMRRVPLESPQELASRFAWPIGSR